MARDWSNLNNDLLLLIAGKLRTLEDFPRFGAVCSNWMNVLMKQEGSFFGRCQLPWLILPCDHEHRDPCQSQCPSRRAFSMVENKVHYLDFPEAYGKKCVGSSHGWLIMVEDVSPAIFMLNPLTNQRIELPPVTTMPDILGFNKEDVGREYIFKCFFSGKIYRRSLKNIERYFTRKIILSNDPKEEDCIAVALCGQLSRLFFCRIGDDKWTQVEYSSKPSQNDVVYSKGRFYFVNCVGKVGFFYVKNPQVTIISEPPYDSIANIFHAMYLAVDTTGALLAISRWVNVDDVQDDHNDIDHNDDDDDGDNNVEAEDNNDVEYDVDNDDDYDDENNVEAEDDHDDEDDDEEDKTHFYKTKEFNVFKLDEEKNKWNKVRDIGENIVFLGENHSVCYSTVEFPECQKNSIYFTDNWEMKGMGMHEGHDVGIFNIDDGLIRKLPCFNEDMPLTTIFPPAVWFTPSVRSSFRTKTA